jgi:hypothetical protein
MEKGRGLAMFEKHCSILISLSKCYLYEKEKRVKPGSLKKQSFFFNCGALDIRLFYCGFKGLNVSRWISRRRRGTAPGIPDFRSRWRMLIDASRSRFNLEGTYFGAQWLQGWVLVPRCGEEQIMFTPAGNWISISRISRPHLDDWLIVHRSITLFDLQLDAQNSYLFTYNTGCRTS